MSVNKVCKLAEEFKKLAMDEDLEDSDFVVSVKASCHRLMDAAKDCNLTTEEEDNLITTLAELTLKLLNSK